MNTEEAAEILCRETNAALEDGNMGFREVTLTPCIYAECSRSQTRTQCMLINILLLEATAW